MRIDVSTHQNTIIMQKREDGPLEKDSLHNVTSPMTTSTYFTNV
jgi:hypothetical protein